MSVIGFRDGFKGLMQNRHVRLDSEGLSGILTLGGTILGTAREKPHKMNVGGKTMDMTHVIKANVEEHHLDTLVCLGRWRHAEERAPAPAGRDSGDHVAEDDRP